MWILMNNYCRNCGEKIDIDTKVCPKCSTEVIKQKIDVQQKEAVMKEFNKKENLYLLIIISLYLIGQLLSYIKLSENNSFIDNIRPLFLLSSILTLIYARITLRKSIKIKILFWIVIGVFLAYIIYLLIIIFSCVGILNRCRY